MHDGMTIYRVMHLCLSGDWGHTAQAALQWAKYFQRTGFMNLVLVKKNTPLHFELKASGVNVEAISSLPFLDFSAKKKIGNFLTEHRANAILVHSLRDLWLLPKDLKFKQKIKVIGFEHRFKLLGSRNNFLYRKLFSQLDSIVTGTQMQKSYLVDRLPLRDERFKVIPNGVDAEVFKPRPLSRELKTRLGVSSPDQVLIVWIGDMRSDQGAVQFIEAAFQIKRMEPKARFAMIEVSETRGSINFKLKLQNQIESFGLNKELKIFAYSELNLKLAQIFSLIDIFCFTAHNESFAQIILEALASGVPTVASSTGSLPEFIDEGRNGLLVLPKDSGALAQAVMRYMQNPKLQQQVRRESRQTVEERFSAENAFRQMLQLLNFEHS